jgi:hypothetical protein
MYVSPNFKTKKALKEALVVGKAVEVYQPNNFFNTQIPANGPVYLEGPHYPQPHKWYAEGTMKDGKLISIR